MTTSEGNRQPGDNPEDFEIMSQAEAASRIARARRPFPIAPCQYPGCTQESVKVTHYFPEHGIKMREHLENRQSDLGYTLCIHCRAHIEGNPHPDGVRHLFAEHLDLFPDLQASMPPQEPEFTQVVEQQAPQPVDFAELLRAAAIEASSVGNILQLAAEQFAEYESRIAMLETENRAKDNRNVHLETDNRDLRLRLNRAQAVIVQMQMQAHNLPELERIAEEYRRSGGR